MNKSKLILVLVISIVMLSPLLIVVVADKKPSYVGFNEGDVYIWKTEFDKDPIEDYYEDRGYSEAQAENITDIIFDLWDLDDDVEGWRVYILEIKDEKEADYGNDEIDYTPYLFNLYEIEDWDEKDWDRELHNERGSVADYDLEFYQDRVFWDLGLFKIFVDPKTDWDDLADEVDEEFEDADADGGVDDEECMFFFMEEKCGISTEWEPEGSSKLDEFESETRYTRNGVLLYYEFEYGGDTIWKLELEYRYIYENWWWMLLIVLGIGLLALVVVIIIKIKR